MKRKGERNLCLGRKPSDLRRSAGHGQKDLCGDKLFLRSFRNKTLTCSDPSRIIGGRTCPSNFTQSAAVSGCHRLAETTLEGGFKYGLKTYQHPKNMKVRVKIFFHRLPLLLLWRHYGCVPPKREMKG